MKERIRDFIARALRAKAADETGSISVLSIQMLLASLVMGGLAVDVGNAFTTRTQLQVAADAAAHAALWSREWNSAEVAKAKAITVVTNMMPTATYGNVLTAADIQFGTWDEDTEKFTANATSKTAVFVSTRRYESRNNSLGTWFLSMAGQDSFDVASGSVFETYYPTCFREGIVAALRVDTHSNITYKPGYCIHSQDHVEINSNNLFETGVVVSMPDKSDVVLPASGYESNIGVEAALRDGSYAIRILDRINSIATGLLDPKHAQYGVMTETSPYYRDYITSSRVVTVRAQGPTNLDKTKFTEGRVHFISCKNDNTHKTINDGENWFKNMILVTDCQINIGSNVVMENAVILSTNTADPAIQLGSGAVIGKDDGCSDAGDVQLVTLGGIRSSADLHVYGSQLLAAKTIEVTANASGIEGASFIAGGEASVTSNGVFGFCGGEGMANNYDAAYFRMVM